MFRHVAAMPDVHLGMGATVGSVIADARGDHPGGGRRRHRLRHERGRGRRSARWTCRTPAAVRSAIEQAVPHGRTDTAAAATAARGATAGRGGGRLDGARAGLRAYRRRSDPKLDREATHAATSARSAPGTTSSSSASTRRTGSGSCSTPDRAASATASAATSSSSRRSEMERWYIEAPRPGPRVPAGGHRATSDDYVEAVDWAQDYAADNRAPDDAGHDRGRLPRHGRRVAPVAERGRQLPPQLRGARAPLRRERARDPQGRGARARGRARHHPRLDGGALLHRPRQGQRRRASSPASHGAGRAMSRGEAKRRFTLEDHGAATEGVECRKDADVIDEIPGAYKDIDARHGRAERPRRGRAHPAGGDDGQGLTGGAAGGGSVSRKSRTTAQ